MNWEELKYFLAVARAGQMLSAANRLGVSQATLNRRVTALESSAGTRLFSRSTSGCELTDEGRRFLAHAERVETEILQLTDNVRQADDPVSGTIRIGAPDGFGVSYLAPRLGPLLDRHPALRVQLVPAPRSFSLSQREADIAVTIGRPKKGLLRAKKLTDYALGLYASKDYLAQKTAPQTTEDLRHHRLIGYVEDMIYAPELDYTSEVLRDWTSAIEVSGSLGQLEAVQAGAGIGILHRFMANAREDLVAILPDTTIARSYWTVWHESLKDSAKVGVVVRYLEEIVGADRSIF